jgi:large subunit ribosomal protein L19
MKTIEAVEQAYLKKDIPEFRVGDTVEVHCRVKEGDKERIQVFRGTVVARRGTGMGEMFKVRRIVQGEGVERTWPVHSPNIATIKVSREGKVRRAKLFYLRDRVGKATKVQAKNLGE